MFVRTACFQLVLVSALLVTPCGWAQDFSSYLEPSRNIDISAPEPGVITQVLVKEGQSVKVGEVLVKLDARVIEQEAEIARQELKYKNRRLEQLKGLLDKKFASPQEIERAESDLEITTLRVKRAEALIERLTLTTPIDGVVTELRYDVSESVPGANSHVATVVQLDPLRVQFNLPVTAARKLKAGDKVPLTFPETGAAAEAVVDFVSPVSTAVVNTVRVTMSIPSGRSGLTAGMKAVYKVEETSTPN